MGGKRKASARQTRRSIEAKAVARIIDVLNTEPDPEPEATQEEIEMTRAYGTAEADGEVKGCTAIVPWETIEDPAFKQDEDDEGDERLFDDPISLVDKFRVLVEQDHLLEYPMLNLSVFINGTLYEEAEFTEMFVRSGCTKATSLDEADLCVFVGGEDVDPQLYGHVQWATTKINPSQDNRDLEVYAYCQAYGIPMVGVCRGAQFLHVMNGGKLFQDVDGHVGDHALYVPGSGTFIQKTPSVHHQMCIVNPQRGMQVLATSNEAKQRRYWCDKTKDFINKVGSAADVEAFFYRPTCCLGFQGHPEYANYPAYTIWCLQMIERHIRHNQDLDYSDSGAVLRIRPETLKERMALIETEEVEVN